MRPEFYANKNLKKAFKFDPSPDSVHDTRVALRKYYVVASALSRLCYLPECLYYSKEIVKILGVIRDSDISGCIPIKRDELVSKVSRLLPKISNCYLPKIYGSRLVVYEKIRDVYLTLEVKEFHEFRKKVRMVYYLVESVGEDASSLKEISKKLGDMRDKFLIESCGKKDFNIPLNQELISEVKAIIREIIMRSEFHHLRDLI